MPKAYDHKAYKRRWYLKHKAEHLARSRSNHLKRKYGISAEDWDVLFEKQNKRCAICGSETPKSNKGWQTDHCHTSGKLRGILCQPCNLLLGNAEDRCDTLLNAVEYLKTNV